MKQAAALLIIILLAACTYQQAPIADPGFSAIAAQATGTAASANVAMTEAAARVTAQAFVSQQSAQATATQASAQATVDAAMMTATVQAQATAVIQATETAYQQSAEAIQLEAQATRARLETDATATAVYLEISQDAAKSGRAEWFWSVMAVILLGFITAAGYGIAKLIHRNAMTVRDANGEVIIFRGHFLLPESIAPPSTEPAGFFTITNTNGSRGEDRYRTPQDLIDQNGRLVYRFSGRQLDAMEINILNGDCGFRRDSSSAGPGLDNLIGMKNRGLFSLIADEMKRRGYIIEVGSGHEWTRAGMTTFLKMNTLPH